MSAIGVTRHNHLHTLMLHPPSESCTRPQKLFKVYHLFYAMLFPAMGSDRAVIYIFQKTLFTYVLHG